MCVQTQMKPTQKSIKFRPNFSKCDKSTNVKFKLNQAFFRINRKKVLNHVQIYIQFQMIRNSHIFF